MWYFYPRSPCGERHSDPVTDKAWALISIHALLAESDASFTLISWPPRLFLSTLSLRRATYTTWLPAARQKVFLSTLSLRRATEYWVGGYGTANNFYPRSPCGERPPRDCPASSPRRYFYPRSPCGERQDIGVQDHGGCLISIHALLAESDFDDLQVPDSVSKISIHALLAESDRTQSQSLSA